MTKDREWEQQRAEALKNATFVRSWTNTSHEGGFMAEFSAAIIAYDARLSSALAEIEALRESLEECSDELCALIGAQYAHSKDKYPDEMRRYKRDMSVVEKARARLQQKEQGQ